MKQWKNNGKLGRFIQSKTASACVFASSVKKLFVKFKNRSKRLVLNILDCVVSQSRIDFALTLSQKRRKASIKAVLLEN